MNPGPSPITIHPPTTLDVAHQGKCLLLHSFALPILRQVQVDLLVQLWSWMFCPCCIVHCFAEDATEKVFLVLFQLHHNATMGASLMSHALHFNASIWQCANCKASSRCQLGSTAQRIGQTNDAFVASDEAFTNFEWVQHFAKLRLSSGGALLDGEVVCSHRTWWWRFLAVNQLLFWIWFCGCICSCHGKQKSHLCLCRRFHDEWCEQWHYCWW